MLMRWGDAGLGTAERRRAAGLSLRLVARSAGTSETNVAAYERGVKQPRAHTLQRLLAMIDAGGDSAIHGETC